MADNKNQGTQSSGRGFASMDPEKQREIASKGGQASHESGHGHEFTSEEAREAGRKGGEASRGGTSSGNNPSGRNEQSGQRGGSSEQHSEAGRQSSKNS